ncbi:MAG: response regulator transcription factor [Actinomycetota bacterium]
MNTRMIRLLIVDDSALDRDGLRLSLMDEEGIEIVGEAANGVEAVERAAELKPDVVLMDLRMPIMNGVEATRQIAEKEGGPRVLLLTTYDTEPDVGGGLKAGAAGYLPKSAPTHDLLRSIRGLMQGGPSVPTIRSATRLRPAGEAPSSPVVPAEPEGPRGKGILEDLEMDILQMVANGFSNGQAAAKLAITEQEVKAALFSVYRKLGKQDRSGAVGEAYRRGLLR